MARGLVRYQQAGDFHFVTFSCFQRLPYLGLALQRKCFEEELDRVRVRYRFVVRGYVVMPEHVHLLVSEPEVGRLSTALQVLKQKTSRLLKPPAADALWYSRYYDFNLRKSDKLVEKLRYIHRNPVRRGLVLRPEDWEWSSYNHYAFAVPGRVGIESECAAV